MSDMKISPLAPETHPVLPPLAGVRMATAEAAIKYAGRADLLTMVFDQPTSVAGVFTKSKCSSAPVDWCRDALLKGGSAKAIVVNAGNANAFTGFKGDEATKATAKAMATACGCLENEIYLASTGVIGEPLEANKITPLLSDLVEKSRSDGWQQAAEAIMTTDTYPKLATTTFDIDGTPITINGIAKGSGMIAPDMATMLSFVVTDAVIDNDLLQSLLSELVGETFNAITVDSDTSTSDTVLLFATGTAKNNRLQGEALAQFTEQLRSVLHDLSMQIVRDGEGATKEIEIYVTGAETDSAAKRIALSIANSPLVKTAVAGEDANWGRVVMAVGKAGEMAERDKLAIWFGDIRVAVAGERDPQYSEDAVSEIMRRDEIKITTDVGVGSGEARVWTCDLTKEYVAINADYRS